MTTFNKVPFPPYTPGRDSRLHIYSLTDDIPLNMEIPTPLVLGVDGKILTDIPLSNIAILEDKTESVDLSDDTYVITRTTVKRHVHFKIHRVLERIFDGKEYINIYVERIPYEPPRCNVCKRKEKNCICEPQDWDD